MAGAVERRDGQLGHALRGDSVVPVRAGKNRDRSITGRTSRLSRTYIGFMNSLSKLPRISLIILIAILILAIFGCSNSTSAPEDEPLSIPRLSAHTWVLKAYTRNGTEQTVSDSAFRIRFSDTGYVSMKGCNWTFGTFDLAVDTITFGPMTRTEMACASPVLTSGDGWSDSLLSEPLIGRFSGANLILQYPPAVFVFKDSASAN